jgi:transketolase
LRIGRTKVPEVTPEGSDGFAFQRADVLRNGSDLTIVATGVMVSRALAAAAALAERNLEARVINVSTIKPLDKATIVAAARETGAIVTVEEATIAGGLGAAVAETVVRNVPVPMRMLGVTEFAPTGTAEFLFDHFGLNAEGIVTAALELKAR